MIGWLLALTLALAACSSDPDIYEVPPVDDETAQAEEQISLPPPVAAVPAFALRGEKAFTRPQLKRLRATPGAAIAAPLVLRRVRVEGPKGGSRLRVAAIDPVDFRSVAPPSTRSADFVWHSLLGGSAIVTHKTAKRLGVTKDAPEVTIAGEGTFIVGAVADNGTPNVSDILLSDVSLPGWKETTAVVVGAETGANLASLRRSVKKKAPQARVTRLIPKTATVAPEITLSQVAAPAPTLSGLHPTMAASVQQLLGAAGGRVWLVSGYRDAARQAQLWAAALEKYGDPDIADNWVARPGHSFHQAGLAVDLGGDLQLAARLVVDLELPLWRPLGHEPWHFELIGSRG